MIKIDNQLIKGLSSKAENSSRKRINYNFHRQSSDLLQRLLNAMEPGTYIQPHKHENPDKREVFLVLKGSFAVVEFSKDGEPAEYIVLNQDDGVFGAEVASGVYHTIISLEKNSVVYEVKDGPYDPATDKIFAPWAPDESSGDGPVFNEYLLQKLNISPEPFQ